MTFFKTTIQQSGNAEQLAALKRLGKVDINYKDFGSAQKTSIFEGSFSNFKNSNLAGMMSDGELKALFELLDTNGDGKLSSAEVSKMSKAGGAKGAGKVDKNDIKALMNDASNYVDSLSSSDKSQKDVKTVKKNKNGSKTVTIEKPDGSKVVKKYNKNGKKTSSVKTAANGDKTVEKYEYIKGHLVNSTSKTTRKVDGKKVVIGTSETRYNEKGKRDKKVTKDASGNILSTTSYSYKHGKLAETTTKRANGNVEKTEYNTSTGKKQSKSIVNKDGTSKTRIDYDSHTGNKKSKSVSSYDENGKLLTLDDYTYKSNGQLSTRIRYDENKNPVLKSNYTYKKDGSMVRTDKDAKTGESKGSTTFNYDKQGRRSGTVVKDAAGNVTGKTSREYYSSDIIKNETSVKYNSDGTQSKVVKNYDKDGNLTSITKTDAAGKITTQKIDVKETDLRDLPKLDRKALEKKYKDSAEEMGKKLTKWAKQFLGYNEANGKYKKFTNGRTEAWCADFVTYCVKNYAKENGIDVKKGFGSPSVSGLMDWAKSNGIFKNTSGMSKSEKLDFAKNKLNPGDVIIWKQGGRSHTGIVTGVNDDGTYTTIEGNSSDQVKTRSYNITTDGTLTGFIPLSKIYKG